MNKDVERALDTGLLVARILERRLPMGLAAYRLLGLLDRAPEGLSPGDLATLLVQEPHSVSGLLNRLEADRLVARLHATEDRRRVQVTLTVLGRQALSAAGDDLDEVDTFIARHLDNEGVLVGLAGHNHDRRAFLKAMLAVRVTTRAEDEAADHARADLEEIAAGKLRP